MPTSARELRATVAHVSEEDTEPQRGRVMFCVSHGWLPGHVGEGRHMDEDEYSPSEMSIAHR